MKLNTQTPKIALNKAFLKQRPLRSEIELFKANLKILLSKVQTKESEENKKNHVRDFLLNTYYKDKNEVNTKDRKDLVIHLGKTNQTNVGVIIEAKSIENKAEMVRLDKVNAKAFHELVLYYFDERNAANNAELKNLIVTNAYEWFIFDANVFDKQICRNTNIKRLYDTYKNDKKDNPFFYDELRKILETNDEEIACTYFNLKTYETFLDNSDLEDDKNLIELFKILSPFHLLKTPFADDGNSLNKPFYDELLHIIGLEEIKIKSKSIIRRKEEGNRNQGSLLENAITILKTKDSLRRVQNIADYGAESEERYFNVALELCLTWINRILFLKLLEAQLVNYHKGNREYRFLNFETIPETGELFTLFHQVLARTLADRDESIKEKYKRVPYLNSSLFEQSEIEEQTITIESLKDSAQLPFISSTVLKEFKAQSRTLNTLEYLFKFLDAYDFASEGAENVQADNRSLINASVLGKVFEKINGYKDGSIYTPGFITMYMCRQAIRLAVIQKFKDKYGWNISEFSDLDNYLKDRRSVLEILEFNELINSIHLCDPAVGSGHFLVSSLNEIIAVKSELGILADEKGVRLSDYEILIETDELIITDEKGDICSYQMHDGKPTAKAQRLQKTLFHEKQTLIENCLFGVDINPNSVKICRLRLWIELLKNAYYKDVQSPNFSLPDGEARRKHAEAWTLNEERKHAEAWTLNFSELETLPNIDINIKEGNSLVSRYSVKDKFRTEKTTKWINDYKNFVQEYKGTKKKARKDELNELIKNFHNEFSDTLPDETTELKKKLTRKIYTLAENQNVLFTERTDVEKEIATRKLKNEIADIENDIAIINAKYKNAFEWRFEFPEVLDNEGNFLGFDIVVGNPPYIALQKMQKEQKAFETQKFKTYAKLSDIYCLFYEKGVQILKEKGLLTYITSNSWLRTQYGELLRKYFVENTNPIWLINIEDAQVFSEATVESNLILLAKENWTQKLQAVALKNDFDLNTSVEDYFKENSVQISDLPLDGWIIGNESESVLKRKIETGSKLVGQLELNTFYGIKTGLNEAFFIDTETRNNLIEEDKNCADVIKPALRGKDISKYNYQWKDIWVIIIKSGWTNANRKDEQPEDFFRQTYPSIYKHFKKVGENSQGKGKGLFNRDDKGDYWWELRPCAYYADFEKEKIVWGELSDEQKFAFDDSGMFANNTIFFMTGKNLKYLLAVLNSSLSKWYFNAISTSSGMGTNRWLKYKIEQLPIKQIEEKDQQPFVALVDQILELKKEGTDTLSLENEIDTLVYRLYDLTDEEIAIVEGKV